MSEPNTEPQNPPKEEPQDPPTGTDSPPAKEPPVETPPTRDNGTKRLDRLEESVQSLNDSVASLVESLKPAEPVKEPDEGPTSVPWTHRGFGRRK